MALPSSPVNGQTATINGIAHVYSSVSSSWTRVATVNSTSGTSPPSSPKVGDIWYNTSTDDIYRYTSDGANSYWLDITGPTVSNAVTYLNTNVYANSFNGTSQYLSVPTNAAFQFGTGDFTVECWFYITYPFGTSGQGRGTLISNRTVASSNTSFSLQHYNGKISFGTVSTDIIVGSTTLNINTWYHVAASRSSGTVRLFLNGASDATAITGNTTNFSDTTGPYIGCDGSYLVPLYPVTGYISNARIVKSTALYTAAFTVPSAPLTAITNTSLLTCQTVPVVDASTNNFTITNVASVGLSIYSAQQSATLSLPVSPTQTILTTATSGTYTVPANVKWLRVRMVGGGGGGGGGGTNGSGGGTAGIGGTSTFGTSLLTAGGGGGGANYFDTGAAGGTASISSPAVGIAFAGAGGGGGASPTGTYPPGGAGGVSPFGGAGAAGVVDTTTTYENAVPNTGSGGGGGGGTVTSAARGGGGGGAGGFIDVIISSPLSSYAYTVGAGGTAGPAGSSGQIGGTGGSGIIIIQEHYNY
jgi:hypothetical protein